MPNERQHQQHARRHAEQRPRAQALLSGFRNLGGAEAIQDVDREKLSSFDLRSVGEEGSNFGGDKFVPVVIIISLSGIPNLVVTIREDRRRTQRCCNPSYRDRQTDDLGQFDLLRM